MQIKNPQYFGQLLHKKGFETWFLYMFRLIETRKFIKEPLHPKLLQAFQDVYDLQYKRLNINICPRSAKTTIARYFVAYTLATNPKANFIYTSYSQALLNDISRDLANILTNPVYLAMYDNGIKEEAQEVQPIDEFWQSYIQEETGKPTFSSRKITTADGGVVLFSSIGGQITGFGSGIRGAKEFSGCLICFDYNEFVLTEIGYIKIGEIVENKLNIKVYSHNFLTQKNELQSISKYIKVENKEIIEVHLNNKQIIKCTPDHKIYIKNKGWIQAKDLIYKDSIKTFSNSFYLQNRQIKFFRYIFSFIILISNLVKFTARKFFNNSRFIINLISKIFKRFFIFNVDNYRWLCVKRFCYVFNPPFIFCNIYNILIGKRCSRKNKCSVFNCILHIFRFGAICKIVKFIIRWITVKMSSFCIFKRFLPYECKQNKFMNSKSLDFAIFTKTNNLITSRKCWFKFFCRESISNFTKFSFTSIRKNITKIRNFIKPLIIRDVFVDKVVFNHKFQDVYCLNINNNNNFYIKKCQDLLVHNCDDANKPSDIYSQVRRNKVKTYFEETLLSRLNDSEVAIINIQQRLHLEDMSGFLLDKYKFELLKMPLVVDGVCQLPSQYTQDRLQELQKNEFMFLSQYQQSPILSSGALFKRDCFIFANNLPSKYEYTFITADLAYKDKQHNDFTCFSYWGVLDKKLYLIDVKRKKINSVEIDNWIRPWLMPKIQYGFRYIWIEDKAHGTYLLQQYRKDGLPVPNEAMIKQTLPRDGDKVMRANNIIPCLNSSDPNVILNNCIENFNDIIEELLSFNQSAHDDFVDTLIDACKIALFVKKEFYAF